MRPRGSLDFAKGSAPNGPSVPSGVTLGEGTRGPSFRVCIGALAVGYFALQIAYICSLPLVMDEFQGAYSVYQFRSLLPYRDFSPYKTTLGYYAQLLPLLLVRDQWIALLASKVFLAGVNTALIITFASVLRKWYSPASVILATVLMVLMSNFLERSSELRVDMLTAWTGGAGLLLLLRQRSGWAGFVTAVSFLVSQKGVYFALAANAGIVLECIVYAQREANRRWLRFNSAFSATIAFYLLAWSLFAPLGTVFRDTFGASTAVAISNPYPGIRAQFWIQSVFRNPFYYGLAVLAFGSLVRRATGEARDCRVTFLAGYFAAIFSLFLWHKQPWPYFFVFLAPVVVVLHSDFFNSVALRGSIRRGTRCLGVAAFIAWGMVLPLMRIPVVLRRDNDLQRRNIRVLQELTATGRTYFAGVNLLFRSKQEPAQLSWLDAPRLDALASADPQYVDTVVAAFDSARSVAVVANYRIEALPPRVAAEIFENFLPFTGNILTYAPVVDPTAGRFFVRLTGLYEVMDSGDLVIDDGPVESGSTLWLTRGEHAIAGTAPSRLRLKLKAPPDELLGPPGAFFPEVYSY